MQKRPDNYAAQAELARRIFLSRDQEAILKNAPVTADDGFIYLTFLSQPCRIDRRTGRIARFEGDWLPADSHGEVLTIFDWLCDAKPHRCLSGIWKTTPGLGLGLHSGLLDHTGAMFAQAIDRDPAAFIRACQSLGGVPFGRGDLAYTLPLFPDLPVTIQFWHSDEEFPPQLSYLWDANTLLYLRYETTYFALGLIKQQLNTLMEGPIREN